MAIATVEVQVKMLKTLISMLFFDVLAFDPLTVPLVRLCGKYVFYIYINILMILKMCYNIPEISVAINSINKDSIEQN